MATTPATKAQPEPTKMPKPGKATVTVLVGSGENAKEVIVHSDLIKLHSKYIDNCAEGLKAHSESKDEGKRLVSLPSHSVEDFEKFCAFMYTGYIYSIADDGQSSQEWNDLARLWALGKFLQSITFMDAVIDALIHREFLSGKYSMMLPMIMAEHLNEPSQLRNLLVDICASCWNNETFAKIPLQVECFPFYRQLIITLHDITVGRKDRQKLISQRRVRSNCLYHEHGSSNLCYKKICPTPSDDVRQKKNKIPNIGTSMVEFHVGSNDNTDYFLIHTELAARYSVFVTTALKECWKEGQERIIHLPDVSPETFQVFSDFVYRGELKFSITHAQEEHDWNCIADAWLLGDYLDSTPFKDIIVDAMLVAMRKTGKIPVTMFQPVFKFSARPSGMRRLLVDVAVFSWFPDTLALQPVEPALVDFFRDVAVLERQCSSNSGQTRKTPPFVGNGANCHYHDHGPGERCYKKLNS